MSSYAKYAASVGFALLTYVLMQQQNLAISLLWTFCLSVFGKPLSQCGKGLNSSREIPEVQELEVML